MAINCQSRTKGTVLGSLGWQITQHRPESKVRLAGMVLNWQITQHRPESKVRLYAGIAVTA